MYSKIICVNFPKLPDINLVRLPKIPFRRLSIVDSSVILADNQRKLRKSLFFFNQILELGHIGKNGYLALDFDWPGKFKGLYLGIDQKRFADNFSELSPLNKMNHLQHNFHDLAFMNSLINNQQKGSSLIYTINLFETYFKYNPDVSPEKAADIFSGFKTDIQIHKGNYTIFNPRKHYWSKENVTTQVDRFLSRMMGLGWHIIEVINKQQFSAMPDFIGSFILLRKNGTVPKEVLKNISSMQYDPQAKRI